MTQPQHQQYRSHTTPPASRVEYRAPDDGEDGVFEVRMPIATTGEVRNQGDDPLTRDELDGMRQQIEERTVGVFLDHGGTNLGGMERYSAVEKVGEWRDPSLETRDDEDGPAELVATAELMDPESLPAGVGDLRAALGSIKEQVKRDFSVSASIGWREDESYPGGNDLMEASIVGIGADPRTTSDADEGVGVVARAAIKAGADPNQLLSEVRSAIGVDGERPLGPPEDPERFDSFEECKQALMEDEDLSEEEAERICGSWENQSVANESVTEQDDTPDESGGTTDEEQDSESERAPEDIGPADFAEFVASHYDGLDAADVTDALDEAGGDYAGSVDVPELASFVADVTDTDTGEAQDALDSLMEGEENEADEDDEEEGEEDEEQSSDEPESGESGESEETQDAVEDDIEERIADLEAILEDVRSGEVDVETPDTDEEQDATDDETTSTVTTEKWGR